MIERFSSFTFSIKNFFREIHELPEIMNAASWNNIITFGKIEFSDKEFQQTRIHFLVINETYRFSFFPVFQSLFNFLNKCCRDIIIHIYLRISCYFEYSGMIMVISEITEYFR